MTVQQAQLTAELSIVVNAIWYEIDFRDGAAVSGYFTEDATLTFSSRTFRGTAEIDQVYSDRHSRGPRVSRHLTTNLHVIESTADTATAVSTLCLFAQDGEPPRPTTTPAMVGDVFDHFVRAGGRWLISSREIQQCFIAPETTLAVPTE